MNELIKRIDKLVGLIQGKEQEALNHEHAGKVCRAEAAELRQRKSELDATVNDAKVIIALQGSATAAKASQDRAEGAAVKVEGLVKELEKHLASLGELKSKKEA